MSLSLSYQKSSFEKAIHRQKLMERELDQFKKKVGKLTLQVDLLKKLQQPLDKKRLMDQDRQ